MAVAIHLAQCAKTFADGTRALEPLDLDLAAGETVVLLGPSGCGKTTTLRIIAGLESPDPGGRVRFDDEDVTAQPIEERGVGMVFQSYALFPNMSVAENIGYGLRVRGVARDEKARRVAEMLELVDLGAFGARRVDQLSGGQKQRVALARALAIRPRVLLLDEPLTALDAKLREQLRVEIDRLLRSLGITAGLRDARPGRGDGARRPHRRDGEGPHRPGRHAAGDLPPPATAFVADFIGTMNRHVFDGREMMFRPEDVRIVDAGNHQVVAKVISTFFLGDHTRLVVDAGGAAPLIVETTERKSWGRGEAVHLAVEPGRLLALPGQGT
jgi:putative spermidine/putrescine transport system ATP-binding protein